MPARKKLSTRLRDLEAQAGEAVELTHDEQSLLVRILGRRDAMYWPWRCTLTIRPPMAEIQQRQRDYLAGTVGVAVKADGKQQWKSAFQMRARLIQAGMIEAQHSSGQITSVFLTTLGEATARALVGDRLYVVKESLHQFMLLCLLSQQTSVKAVRESVLFGIECVGDPSGWDYQTEKMLPLLTCGLVTSHSDTEGRIAYTPQGGIDAPEPPAVTVSSHPDFDAAYIAAFDAELKVLNATKPRDPDALYICLPATGWGWPCYFPQELFPKESEQ